jgi:serine palmitoyltransferase
LIEEWTPEPLVEAPTELEQSYINKIPVISGYIPRSVDVNGRPSGPKTRLSNGKTLTNLASYNFLNFGNLERIRNKAVDILHDYGVGACGPPGFYGTLGTSIPSL